MARSTAPFDDQRPDTAATRMTDSLQNLTAQADQFAKDGGADGGENSATLDSSRPDGCSAAGCRWDQRPRHPTRACRRSSGGRSMRPCGRMATSSPSRPRSGPVRAPRPDQTSALPVHLPTGGRGPGCASPSVCWATRCPMRRICTGSKPAPLDDAAPGRRRRRGRTAPARGRRQRHERSCRRRIFRIGRCQGRECAERLAAAFRRPPAPRPPAACRAHVRTMRSGAPGPHEA